MVGYYAMDEIAKRNSVLFDLFDKSDIHGHLKHSELRQGNDYFNLIEIPNQYYLVHMWGHDSKKFSLVAKAGDSIAKCSNCDTLKLYTSYGVRCFKIDR